MVSSRYTLQVFSMPKVAILDVEIVCDVVGLVEGEAAINSDTSSQHF
jgi:hypothetical protein